MRVLVAADIGQDFPAALAFLAIGTNEHDSNARHLGQTEGIGGCRIRGHREIRGDAQIGEIGRSETVLFWHTGGSAALFAYAEKFAPDGNPAGARPAGGTATGDAKK